MPVLYAMFMKDSQECTVKLYLPSYETCFVCGKKNPNGLRLCFYIEDGRVTSEFSPREELCGFSGVLHGGIISSIIDETLWWSSAVGAERLVLTRNLRLTYLRPVVVGKSYRVEADPPQPEGRHYLCRGRIVERAGAVCVKGEGSYSPLRWGKNRYPPDLLAYVDESGNPLPEERFYRFPMPGHRGSGLSPV
ncbi:MAG: PaaI family thioesterase [Deltaproteobacteria bacterium]|nr:PaaI family thioesterase [Deltaproteobacteria bacterium]